MKFFQKVQLVASAVTVRGGRPLAYAVHREDCRAFKGRREEGGGCVRFVMLGEEDFAFEVGLFRYVLTNPKLLAQPDGHCHQKRSKPARRVINVSLKQTLKRHERLVVEGHVVNFRARDASLAETEFKRAGRENIVMLLACEALLLTGRDNLAVAQDARSRDMIASGDSKYMHG